MVNFEYLYKGLCGLARAHRANTMAGHLGAAVIAGYFFGEDHPDLDRKVYAGIEGELDRVLRGEESIWFNAKKAGITIPQLFEPLVHRRASPKRAAGRCGVWGESHLPACSVTEPQHHIPPRSSSHNTLHPPLRERLRKRTYL